MQPSSRRDFLAATAGGIALVKCGNQADRSPAVGESGPHVIDFHQHTNYSIDPTTIW